MSFSLFSKKQKKEGQLYLSLDIGTEFVKAIVFSVQNNKMNVKGVGKIRQSITAVKRGQVTNIKNVLDCSRAAIEKATENLKMVLPQEVVVGVAGELVKGISVTANYDREKPEEKITVSEVNQLFAKIRESAKQEAKKAFTDIGGHNNPQIREISACIIDAYIDGYRVENVIGFSGKKLKIVTYTTFIPQVHIGAINTILKSLKLKPLLVAAEPFAIARSIKGAREEGYEAIIIDIGSGTTDIALVKNGGLVDTHMLAFGGRVFTKRIANEMHVGYDEAEKLKIDYSNSKLDRPNSNIIKKALSKDIRLWVMGVDLALREFDSINLFPSVILLCGGGSLLPEIRDCLIEYPWKDYFPFNKNPNVIFLKPPDIDGIVDNGLLLEGVDMVTPVSLAHLVLDINNNFEFVKGYG